ncbi:MAG: bifunctional 3,4-dihydroxy-2-butanone-4-phosphate synthase/GTP cyclohydrolase II [Gemmatimonadota bacterium]|nr:bifunctional 3,4-dihydroxy-2-butanone-4-phosphate synthase/GTP cyclohydrolase II [Gemmatimonadota bacterium]
MISIEEVLEQIHQGRMVILVDDEHRENEGDFIMAAEKVTPEAVNFMARHGGGLICAALPEKRADELMLGPMVGENTSLHGTQFAVSVDLAEGTSTGISAFDRAATIKALADPRTRPGDFARPGHIFPLRAKTGGVLRRAGHTEAVVDLARLAGMNEAGVLCEIMDEDGSMARLPRLFEIADQFGLSVACIQDLIRYRQTREKIILRTEETVLPTAFGKFDLYLYETQYDNEAHLALVCGEVAGKKDVLVRVHSSCLTGDTLMSMRCDCNYQLHTALERIQQEGCGVLVYLNQEGRGIGLANKIKAYALQDKGLDTVDANIELGLAVDQRDYGVGIQILQDLGLTSVRLMTNNPKKVDAFIYHGFGLSVSDQVPIEADPNEFNDRYLETKRLRMGHKLKKTAKKAGGRSRGTPESDCQGEDREKQGAKAEKQGTKLKTRHKGTK